MMSFKDAVVAELAQITSRLLELHAREIAQVRRECRSTCAEDMPQLFKGKNVVNPGRPTTPRGDEGATIEAKCLHAIEDKSSTCDDLLCCGPSVSAFGEAMSMQDVLLRSEEQGRSIQSIVAMKEHALVHIDCAYGLRDADHMVGQGFSDPYCVCKVIGKAAEWEFKTKTISDNLNPVWDHFEEFALDGHASDYLLEFKVMDSDVGKTDDKLGSAHLPLGACYPGGFNDCLCLDNGVAQLQVNVDFFNDDSENVADMMARSREHWNIDPAQRRSTITSVGALMLPQTGDLKRRMYHQNQGTGVMDRLVLAPNSHLRIAWDISSLFSILYDVFTVPAIIAFDVEPSSGILIGSCILTLYWTVDLVSNFFTGFTVHGVIEKRFRAVAWKYLKGWFLADLLVVLTDWVFIIAAFGARGLSPGNRLLKASRATKAIRLISLLRTTKVSIYMPDIFQRYSETVMICTHLVERLLCIVILTHCICCLWYGIGVVDGDAPTWVQQRGIKSDSFAFRYAVSFDWALAQFTPSPTDTHPQNLRERIFKIFVDFCGLVTFSAFISTITSRMARLRAMKTEKSAQQSKLSRYFAANKVSLDLSRRVVKVVNAREHEYNILQVREQELSLLEGLPERLLQELRVEVRMPPLFSHPFFKFLYECEPESIYEVCHKYIQEHIVMTGHEIFLRGTLAKHMFFVAKGCLLYRRRGRSVDIDHGGWLSEASIWIKSWVHRGDAVASNMGTVMNLDAVQFQTLMMSRLTWHQKYSAGIQQFIDAYISRFIGDGEAALAGTNEHFSCSDIWGDAERVGTHCRFALKAVSSNFDIQCSNRYRISNYLRGQSAEGSRPSKSML